MTEEIAVNTANCGKAGFKLSRSRVKISGVLSAR